MKTTKQILLDAAELISVEGWTQGQGHDPVTGGSCMGRAIEACAGLHSEWPAWRAVEDSVMKGNPVWSLTSWNDAPGRTAEEVIAKLREVAASLSD